MRPLSARALSHVVLCARGMRVACTRGGDVRKVEIR